jgi:hypothetical protein
MTTFITGTPTTAGNYSATIRANDGHGHHADQQFDFEVSPAGSTTLQQAVQSMSVGTWLNFPISNLEALFESSNSRLTFSNSWGWNPFTRTGEFVGNDHGLPELWRWRYDEATHTFAEVFPRPGVTGHGFDHNAAAHNSASFYHRVYNTLQVLRSTGGSYSALPNWGPAVQGDTLGMDWWSGAFDGSGGQGCLVIFNMGNANTSATDGYLTAWSPVSDSWFWSMVGAAPNASGGNNTCIAKYSKAQNRLIYGGGSGLGGRLFALLSDRSRITYPVAPFPVGIQLANVVCCPISGHALLLGPSAFVELNVLTGVYTTLTGSRAPPAFPNGPGNPGPGNLDGVVSAAITFADNPNLGALWYLSCRGFGPATSFIYRHM